MPLSVEQLVKGSSLDESKHFACIKVEAIATTTA